MRETRPTAAITTAAKKARKKDDIAEQAALLWLLFRRVSFALCDVVLNEVFSDRKHRGVDPRKSFVNA